MSKVVHLSSTSHARAKEYCRQHSLRMSEWVGGLIDTACQQAGIAPVPASALERELVGKKSLPSFTAEVKQGADDQQPSYAAPPFWAETPA